MNPTRFQLLRGYIARLLNAAKPNLYPEGDLFIGLCTVVVPKPVESEFETVLQRMEHSKQILRHRTEYEGVKTKLTDVGESELLQ